MSFDTSAKDDGDGSKNGEFPTDFWAVREKVGAGSYSTVVSFQINTLSPSLQILWLRLKAPHNVN